MSRFSSSARLLGLPHLQPTLQPAVEVLNRADTFVALRTGIEQISALERDLAQLLPDYLVAGVRPSFIKDGVLTLFAAHNALAARLRHIEPRVVTDLQQRGWNLHALTIRIRPRLIEALAPVKEARMTAVGVKSLLALSDTLTPSPLQTALANMANRHRAVLSEAS